MVARKRRRAGVSSRQWLGWGLAVAVVVGVAYLAVERGLLPSESLRGALPGQALTCPAGRTTSSLFYSQSEGIGRSFFYWRAWRLAVEDALDQVPCDIQNSRRIIRGELSLNPACEKDGEAMCQRMKTNVSDPAFPGRFGRNLAKYSCQRVRARRLPHPGWRWGEWEILVNCQVLCSCTQRWKQVDPPLEAPDPEPEQGNVLPPNEPDLPPEQDPVVQKSPMPQPSPQEPVVTTTPRPADNLTPSV